MVSVWCRNRGMKAKINAAVLFLGSSIIIAYLLLVLPQDNRPVAFPMAASALGFMAAALVIFVKPRVGYLCGLLAGPLSLHWFSRIEFWDFPPLNSWILLNLPDGNPEASIAKVRIFFVALVVASTACALTRLLPTHWTLRKIPVRDQTWPAFVVCFAVLASWYGVSARPFRIPYIVDAVQPELTVLHVQKDGVQFHESAVTVYRDGKFNVTRNDRRLFHYRFEVREVQGVLPQTMTMQVRQVVQSPQIRDLRTLPAIALRSRRAEGWYIRTSQGVTAFTSEFGTEPPSEIVDLFRNLESSTPAERNLGTLKDVCLGFCYDPLAGLGLLYMNDRCKGQDGTRCE